MCSLNFYMLLALYIVRSNFLSVDSGIVTKKITLSC